MKKHLITLFLCFIIFAAKAQTASVHPSTFGIQTGFLGIWGYNEAKLTNQIALRSEIGFDAGIWGGSYYEKTGFLLTPVITAEPRLYYNLDKRRAKGKNTSSNSGNFISLKASFHPDWFVISNYSDIKIISDISIIPTWGIRRVIGSHFNYEAGIGLGYRYIFAKQAGFYENESQLAVNIHLRVGYTF